MDRGDSHDPLPPMGLNASLASSSVRVVEVGRRRVARLMRRARHRRDHPTQSAGASPSPTPQRRRVPDLLRREFTAPMPGLKLVGDISCFPTGEGWLYLATVLDLCSKELIGYAIAPHMARQPCGRRG